MTLNILVKKLKQEFEPEQYESFEYLRHDSALSHIEKTIHTVGYYKDHILSGKYYDRDFRKTLICGDCVLESTSKSESAINFFAQRHQSVAEAENPTFIKNLLLSIIQEYIPDQEVACRLYNDLTQLLSTYPTGGNLYSICVPKEKFNESCYFSKPFGVPLKNQGQLRKNLEEMQNGRNPNGYPQIRILAHKIRSEDGYHVILNSTFSNEEILRIENEFALCLQAALTGYRAFQKINIPRSCLNNRIPSGEKFTMHIMEAVKSYFLAAYTEGSQSDKKRRRIKEKIYLVERANHGLAHALRQGALSKDIFNFLTQRLNSDFSGIVEWARRKNQTDRLWIQKIQAAASFQRSGCQSECSFTLHPELYKKYERQDAQNFKKTFAQSPLLFPYELERQIFEEALLWYNSGTLDKNKNEDLKYLRRIFHAAHTLDLRRIPSFNAERIQQEAIESLFGTSQLEMNTFTDLFWKRSGDYLMATGDRDLVDGSDYQDHFFLQSQNPSELVHAINSVSQKAL